MAINRIKKSSPAKLKNLFDMAPFGYVSIDKKGKILAANMNAAKILNKDRSHIEAKTLSKWIPKEHKKNYIDHLNSCFNENKKSANICEIEIRPEGRDPVFVELHSVLKKNSKTKAPYLNMAIMDISEKKKIQVLESKNQQLIDERTIREGFISTLSHDLRTPLTSSKLCAQMLNSKHEDIERHKKLLHLMVEELDRADRMIRDLLDANKIRGDKNIPLVKKRCDLDRICRQYIENLIVLNPHYKIIYQASGKMLGHWSKDGLIRILENLVINAFKYGDNSRPVTISLSDVKETIVLTVHNFGNPISSYDQNRIFEAFYRGKDISQSHTGWGLGLNLVNTLVKCHDGTIKLKSSQEEGTSFSVTLPKFSLNCQV